jgi:hypothetical protein
MHVNPRLPSNKSSQQLTVLAKLKRDQDLLDALKPTMVKNDVEPNFSNKKGSLELKQTRFSTRMRTSANQVRMHLSAHIKIEGSHHCLAHHCRVQDRILGIEIFRWRSCEVQGWRNSEGDGENCVSEGKGCGGADQGRFSHGRRRQDLRGVYHRQGGANQCGDR